MQPIPYGRQSISKEDIAAVVETLQSDFLTQGPKIEEFETKFAAYVGAPHAIALANGTAALHLAAMALDVKPGQKVITTPITFAASANCVRYCGGEVAFADIDTETYLMCPDALRKRLKASPAGTYSGLIPVDFAGLPVDLEVFRKIADEFGLWILEDACHAPGGSFLTSKGATARCGDSSLADLAIFSFHPVKHIACGEGGMVTARSSALAERVKLLRTHGICKQPEHLPEGSPAWYHEMQELGYNYRLTDFQAALGISQLAKAEKGLARRRAIAARYDSAFRGRIRTQKTPAGRQHAFHLYVVEAENRDELYSHLRNCSIFPQVHYIPVHLHPYYQRLGWKSGDFPAAEAYFKRCLSLPMFPDLSDADQDRVIQAVLEVAR